MKTVLFNIHDLVLLLTVGACALLGLMHVGGWRRPRASGIALGLFLVVTALVAINTLIFWAEPIRHPLFAIAPYLYLFLGASMFMLGPLLYWQLKLHVETDFRVSCRQVWHCLPALLALLYLYVECFRFAPGVQRELLLNQQIYQQPDAHYSAFITLSKLHPVAYAAVGLALIVRLTRAGRVARAVWREHLYLVGGFLAVWLWAALTHGFGTLRPGAASDVMGILGNYFNLCLLLVLIGRELRLLWQPTAHPASTSPRESPAFDRQLLGAIVKAMTEDKVFLNSQLTLERLAERVDASPREVSAVINRRFHRNFHEFVSGYRINEVKQKLRDPAFKDWSIADIALSAGFNSKATFHRFFRKFEGTTPGAYRHKQSGSAPVLRSSPHNA